jgi:hypothetical protein
VLIIFKVMIDPQRIRLQDTSFQAIVLMHRTQPSNSTLSVSRAIALVCCCVANAEQAKSVENADFVILQVALK